MPDLDAPARAPSRIFSLQDALPKPRTPSGNGVAPSPVDQLVRTMHTVKAARFNAAQRLELKHLVSVVALSVVSLYFVGLSVWQAVYAPTLSEPTNRLITLVSIMSSICTLVLALIEAMNDYKIKAYHMHACALAVNDLLLELRLIEACDAATVQAFRRRYNAVVQGCPFNHARIDYLMARPATRWGRKLATSARYVADVYGLYGLCLAGPPLLLLLFH
jgi:SMODS and SLOG-associating 2TM effector domain family 5